MPSANQHRTRPRQSRRCAPLAVLVGLVLAALTGLVLGAVSLAGGLTSGGLPQTSLGDQIDDAVSGSRFSLVDFEIQSVFNRWLGDVGAFVRGRDKWDGAETDAIVQRYFDLRFAISAQRADGATTVAALEVERDDLENRAERTLERRVGAALREAGFSRPLPLFGDQDLLWPPVDVELARPPRVLTVSPRDEIRIARSVLLDPDLSLDEIERIEAGVEADGRWSALVETIGGLGAYPAIVRDTRSYASTVDTIAHEWTHNYLFFYPLGFKFFDSRELRTINETVANIVGAEIAGAVLAAAPGVQPRAAPPGDLTESDAILFQLRRDVDDLLAGGRVVEAEILMEATRLELAEIGRDFRRINQAFFASNGVYADTPMSSSQIGPLLRDLRARAGSLGTFVEIVREVESASELEEVVALAGAP
jgi:hypothetical protein